MPQQERETAYLNGYIVSESNRDHPDDHVKVAFKNKIEAIWRKCRRDRAKLLEEKIPWLKKTRHKMGGGGGEIYMTSQILVKLRRIFN